MTLLLLFGQPAAATPQTWTGTAGTITQTGASGTFSAATTWTASTATINIAGTSRTFTSAATWTGSTGTATITGSSRTFTSTTNWTATAGTITQTAASSTFTAGPATWTGNAASILIQAISGDFGPVTPTGSTGSPHFGKYHPITFDYQPKTDDQLALILALI